MLNISSNTIRGNFENDKYSTLSRVEAKRTKKLLLRLLKWTFFLLFIVMMLPWSQNVRSYGNVTTLRPEQRPQTIHTFIDGRIEKWFVREGEIIQKGDTIAIIAEIKDNYLDDQLLERTQNQVELKRQSVEAYGKKIGAQERQLGALSDQQQLKLEQAKIKIAQGQLMMQNDSINLRAAEIDYATARLRYDRMDSLYQRGLKSLTDLEARNLTMQQAKAKEISARNNWQNSKTEYQRLYLDLTTIRAEYDTYYSKVLAEQLSASTDQFDAESMVNKLQNQYSNYKARRGYHCITAPQDGYVTEAFVNGLGESVKAGQKIVSIMPSSYDLAVEVYIDPIDLPLMHIGEKVQVQFDGWPAIVFSGWPKASIGTFSGEIYAIDQYIGANGKYRLLLRPLANEENWPSALRVGAGARAMIILNDVPIWYELWRKINGFPPDFYQPKNVKNVDVASK